jgi:branched-chain amino acid transport system permease protein
VSAEDRIQGRAGGRGLRLRLPAWLPAKAVLLFVVVLAVLYAAPLVVSFGDYIHSVIGLTFMFMSAALAWNWLGGYVGQISFGHAAMFGVGGFVAARLAIGLGLPFWATWLIGGLTAGTYGLLWGHPTLRLRGPYFSIATIGVAEATRLVATYWDEFTGGSSGLSLPIAQGPTKYALYWYGLYLLTGVAALSYWLRRSRIGLGLLAIKEDVDAAAGVGVNATFYQDLVLFLSGVVVGICGAFYASYQAFIDPLDMFSFDRSIGFVLMGVIGGIGTIFGPMLGAIVFVLIQELLLASYPQLYLGLYGVLLVLVILFEPLGLSGILLRIARRLGYRPAADVAAGGLISSSIAGQAAAAGDAQPQPQRKGEIRGTGQEAEEAEEARHDPAARR